MEKRKEGSALRNILLTFLAAVLLFGFALAVPSGTVREDEDAWGEPDDRYEEYDEDNDENEPDDYEPDDL